MDSVYMYGLYSVSQGWTGPELDCTGPLGSPEGTLPLPLPVSGDKHRWSGLYHSHRDIYGSYTCSQVIEIKVLFCAPASRPNLHSGPPSSIPTVILSEHIQRPILCLTCRVQTPQKWCSRQFFHVTHYIDLFKSWKKACTYRVGCTGFKICAPCSQTVHTGRLSNREY